MDKELFSQGYTKLLYKITVTDKSLVPVQITIPDSGYNIIRLYNPKSSFYPLAVGNKWIYDKRYLTSSGEYIHSEYVTRSVLKDTAINVQKYFIIKEIDGSTSFERVDSASANTFRAVFLPNGVKEVLIDSMDVIITDTVRSYRFDSDSIFYVTNHTNGLLKYESTDSFFYYVLKSDIGLYQCYFPLEQSPNYIGCGYFFAGGVINGIAYGDTTLLDTEEDYKSVSDFRIFQNYPNPFNPSTIISYDLPKASRIRLELFNVLGEKVALLVDDEMEAGRHTCELSSQRLNLPSGIYICRIITNNFVKSIKMNLIK